MNFSKRSFSVSPSAVTFFSMAWSMVTTLRIGLAAVAVSAAEAPFRDAAANKAIRKVAGKAAMTSRDYVKQE